jgi:uncharacterized RDD family membrane protein YckC
MGRTQTLQIRTPEGIVFSHSLAGPITRFTAWLIDCLCLLAVNLALSFLVGMLGALSIGFARAVQIILFFALSIGYRIVLEWRWRGQTIGKRALSLRVVDAQGLRVQFSQIVIRNLLRFVDALPAFYLVGGIACVASQRGQRLGDFAANTVVIRHPKLTEPDLDQILSGKYNSFREHPHLEARLRQRLSAGEAGLALHALLRRNQLAPQARVELFSEMAEHFRSKASFPPEATDGLTDEQYVRNVVDTLYRTRGAQKRDQVTADRSKSQAVAQNPAQQDQGPMPQ